MTGSYVKLFVGEHVHDVETEANTYTELEGYRPITCSVTEVRGCKCPEHRTIEPPDVQIALAVVFTNK